MRRGRPSWVYRVPSWESLAMNLPWLGMVYICLYCPFMVVPWVCDTSTTLSWLFVVFQGILGDNMEELPWHFYDYCDCDLLWLVVWLVVHASDWFTVINIVSVVSVVIKHDQVYVSIIYCDINCNQVLYIVLIVTVIPSWSALEFGGWIRSPGKLRKGTWLSG
jgi:hypothetical protein